LISNLNIVIKLVLLTLYSSVIESRRMRWAGHVARMGEKRGVYTILVGNLGRDHLKHQEVGGVDNIKMDL
jgi:hypothetical protein